MAQDEKRSQQTLVLIGGPGGGVSVGGNGRQASEEDGAPVVDNSIMHTPVDLSGCLGVSDRVGSHGVGTQDTAGDGSFQYDLWST